MNVNTRYNPMDIFCCSCFFVVVCHVRCKCDYDKSDEVIKSNDNNSSGILVVTTYCVKFVKSLWCTDCDTKLLLILSIGGELSMWWVAFISPNSQMIICGGGSIQSRFWWCTHGECLNFSLALYSICPFLTCFFHIIFLVSTLGLYIGPFDGVRLCIYAYYVYIFAYVCVCVSWLVGAACVSVHVLNDTCSPLHFWLRVLNKLTSSHCVNCHYCPDVVVVVDFSIHHSMTLKESAHVNDWRGSAVRCSHYCFRSIIMPFTREFSSNGLSSGNLLVLIICSVSLEYY